MNDYLIWAWNMEKKEIISEKWDKGTNDFNSFQNLMENDLIRFVSEIEISEYIFGWKWKISKENIFILQSKNDSNFWSPISDLLFFIYKSFLDPLAFWVFIFTSIEHNKKIILKNQNDLKEIYNEMVLDFHQATNRRFETILQTL
jgi:hypothetical protein